MKIFTVQKSSIFPDQNIKQIVASIGSIGASKKALKMEEYF